MLKCGFKSRIIVPIGKRGYIGSVKAASENPNDCHG